MKKYVVFGTGRIGKRALSVYKDEIDFFIDNDKRKEGEFLGGISIKSPQSITKDDEHVFLVASEYYEDEMVEQLQQMGIDNYVVFKEYKKIYGGTDELIANPYENNNMMGAATEDEWNENLQNSRKRDIVFRRGEKLFENVPLFEHIEIETINRCNGLCEFCPVSVQNEKRIYKEMEWSLFTKIIDELAEMNYQGRLALFSNNEPFLDKTIIEKHKYAREKVQNARIHLYTNGVLLSIEKLEAILPYLDELVIDNYNQDLKLIKSCEKIVEYSKQHPEIVDKVTIVLRKPKEILTSRGGDAPNRKEMVSYPDDRCLLPFKQMIIRPDGKVSLCCNDPLGKNTLGDLTKEKLTEIWYGNKFNVVRKCLYEGRENWEHCKYCDTFYL